MCEFLVPPLYIQLHNFTILISTNKNYVDPCYEIFPFLQLISPSEVQNLLLSPFLLNILNIVSRYTETSVFHIPSPTHPFTHPPKSEQTCNLHISDPFLNIRNRTGCRSIVLYCIVLYCIPYFKRIYWLPSRRDFILHSADGTWTKTPTRSNVPPEMMRVSGNHCVYVHGNTLFFFYLNLFPLYRGILLWNWQQYVPSERWHVLTKTTRHHLQDLKFFTESRNEPLISYLGNTNLRVLIFGTCWM